MTSQTTATSTTSQLTANLAPPTPVATSKARLTPLPNYRLKLTTTPFVLTKASTQFVFTLDKSYTTSAGAYKTDGTLVKTLWRKVNYAAGTHTAIWDGTDDNGIAVSPGKYQIRLLYHNVKYLWEGVIGNTSSSFTGLGVHRALLSMSGLAIDGNKAFYTVGYNEGQAGVYRFSTSNPQQVQTHLFHKDYKSAFNYVATDGKLAYFANVGTGWDTTSFVIASKISNNSQATFPYGVVKGTNIYDQNYWNNVIDWETKEPPTGLAVQKNGIILAVAHSGANEIRLFDKYNGNLLRTINVTNPQGIATAPNGDLWVICKTNGIRVVRRYTNLETNPTAVTTLMSLSLPVAVAVHPQDNNIVMVADGGSSQQVKAFNSTGSSLWTYGEQGGYANGSTVKNNKFWFQPLNGISTFLAIQSDGSFWVNDRGNYRTMHFSASRQYLEHIMFLKYSRVATVDLNNPTRLFNECLEFHVDYSKPLAPNNGSWSLVRNWCYGTPYANHDNTGLSTVVTLNNGRTYGLITDTHNGDYKNLVELVTSRTRSGLRQTGITLKDAYGDGQSLEADGAIQFLRSANGVQTFYKKTLAGFDTVGNPQWNPPILLAKVPTEFKDPYYHLSPFPARTRVTSSGVVVSFDPSTKGNTGWHLGGVKLGSNKWLWRASPTGWTDGHGTYQTQEVDGSIQYAGNFSMVNGRNIFYGFHGEFWKHRPTGNVGQANQWMHFFDDGLFVGQFGRSWYAGNPYFEGKGAVAGSAGNAFSPTVIKVNGKMYLYHNDESSHSGVHRWLIEGTARIKELSGTGFLGETIQLF
ncbi:hypothetical protein [Nostoc sp.]|uniref:hypothetical protein n=1 Tax=Nostoc sp. TaxID=1180 RepID=UPI003593C0CB